MKHTIVLYSNYLFLDEKNCSFNIFLKFEQADCQINLIVHWPLPLKHGFPN